MTTKEKILNLFASLPAKEQNTLLKELNNSRINMAKQTENSSIENCPHCQSSLIVKNGKYKGTQKYKCKSCCRIFTSKTGTSSHKIQKLEKFEAYKTLMLEGYFPLKKMVSKIGISIQTAFDWRHKILGGLEFTEKEFDGITEIDDIWFLYSQKGRKGLKYSRKRGGSKRRGDNDFQAKILITADRKSNIDLSLVRIGRLKKSDIERKVAGKFKEGAILVSDKHSSISAFAKSAGIKHISFKASEHTAGKQYNVQKVNNMAARLKDVVNHRLRGVSTKYLQSYANWFALSERANPDAELHKTLVRNKNTWNLHTNFEATYKRFIKNFSRRTYRCPVKRCFKSQLSEAEIVSKLKYI